MPNKNYLAGRRFEYKVAKEYRDLGWTVLRTAGSKGPFDLVAVSQDGAVTFIQCKVTKDEATAKRLTKAFRENPPLPLTNTYSQEITIQVTSHRLRRTAWA